MVELPAYLDALASAEPAGGFLEVRFKAPDGRGMRQVFIPCEERRRVAELVLELGSRTDLYVGVAPRRRRHGGRSAIDHVHVLWADCDGPAAVAALHAFSPRPSMVVPSGSGGNVHAYWPVWPPAGPDEAEQGNRRLAHRLRADMAATDAARVLRPPSSFNHKTGEPVPVTVERLEAEVYTVEEVVGHLPDPEPRRRAPRQTGVIALAGDDPLLSIAPAVYIEALTGREVGRDGKAQCPFHAGGEERTPSLHAYSTAEAGWTCFAGCGGGTIIDLGVRVYGIEARGRGYWEIRRRLEADLLPALRAAA